MNKSKSKPMLFISYRHNIASFIAKVRHCLIRQAEIDCYFHKEDRKAGEFPKALTEAIKNSDFFIFFLSSDTKDSPWQLEEIDYWLELHEEKTDKIVVVNLGEEDLPINRPNLGKEDMPINRANLQDVERIKIANYQSASTNAHLDCAKEIFRLLRFNAASFDDLPTSIDSRYEKDIIKLYKENNDILPLEFIAKGYPQKWPEACSFRNVDNYKFIQNPLNQEIYGKYRSDDSCINVDARLNQQFDEAESRASLIPLTLPEAGPRSKILDFPNTLRVAILVSGGIAPGINAVISAITDRHCTYEMEYKNKKSGNRLHNVEILGCIEGFNSLCSDGGRIISLDIEQIRASANRGGSLLPTARADQLLNKDPVMREKLLFKIVNKLKDRQINILYIIGGEGSMRATHAIWTIYKQQYPNRCLSVIGIPKTMDNDILWVWQSFGFLSAVEKARQNIIQLSTEVISNPRLGIMQLFGSSSGFVVSHAALGSNVCDLALIPELTFKMRDLCKYMGELISERLSSAKQNNMVNHSPYALIVISEIAIPEDFEDYINVEYVGLTPDEKNELKRFKRNKRKVLGQTPDALRSAGLKLVSKVLQKYIKEVMGKGDKNALGPELSSLPPGTPADYWKNFRVVTNEPRHLIRSMKPTVSDVAYGVRLGTMAVDMALAGYTDCMVSQWLTEYVVVPLKLVVLGRKQVPQEGIFWRTVVSKTGQIKYESLTGIPIIERRKMKKTQ